MVGGRGGQNCVEVSDRAGRGIGSSSSAFADAAQYAALVLSSHAAQYLLIAEIVLISIFVRTYRRPLSWR
jgi:hypothetical protein